MEMTEVTEHAHNRWSWDSLPSRKGGARMEGTGPRDAKRNLAFDVFKTRRKEVWGKRWGRKCLLAV